MFLESVTEREALELVRHYARKIELDAMDAGAREPICLANLNNHLERMSRLLRAASDARKPRRD